MNKVSNNLVWFQRQLTMAEAILATALAKSERFAKRDKEIIDRIKYDVEMADLTLLQLLSPQK